MAESLYRVSEVIGVSSESYDRGGRGVSLVTPRPVLSP